MIPAMLKILLFLSDFSDGYLVEGLVLLKLVDSADGIVEPAV